MHLKLRRMNDTQKLISVSLIFTLSLLFVRVIYTGGLMYFFYPWNLFLGLIPLFFSGLLVKQKTINYKSILFFGMWLLFVPNAPYLITDIFHFEARPPVPSWFDLMLVVSGAWCGILCFIVSLLRIENFLNAVCTRNFANTIMPLLILLCGYGVYIGRYLRYNSWDVITNPFNIIKTSTHHIHHPFQNLNVWLFTFIFSLFLGIMYFTIKKLPRALFATGQF
ncbi:MAG: DUF1361 domain-containing protein [Parafilimonas sp.]